MKTRNGTTKLSMVALAVASLLNATPARADDAEAEALKRPTNTAELGVYNANGSSAKFGEYTGINKAGANLIGNVNVRGGDAYDQQGGTNRWSVIGTDLGLTSESLGASYSNQGRWKLGFNYDELRHNLSDTYQTPYVGEMGGNSYRLPAGFGLVPSTGAGTNAMSAAQLAAFHNVDIATTRKNTSLNGELALSSRWGISFDLNHLDQSGAKLMGFGAAGFGGATGEAVSILPMPTNYTTDNMRFALNWMGDKGHMSAAYFGSFFRDGYDRVNFQTWAGASNMQVMATAPDNDFHQLSLAGGYAFAPKTKLAGSLSYGRNTQNVPYVYDAGMMVSGPPVTSSDGLVETRHADLKLTDQTTKDLALAAGMRYDTRDNNTGSYIYNFNAIDGSHPANYPNAPRSYKRINYDASGDYRLTKDHFVRLDYNHESLNRWCNNYASGGGTPAYAPGALCVVATESQEDKLGATYRAKAGEDIDYRVGYAVAKRVTTSNPYARTPFISTNGGIPLGTAGPTGQNGGDFLGFSPAFDGSRTQQILKARANWQISEKWTTGIDGRFTKDNYDAAYGEQAGNTWMLNLDASYAHSENLSFTSFLTRQQRQRAMTDLQAYTGSNPLLNNVGTLTALSRPTAATWSDTLMEDDIMFGFGVKQKGLMGGKLELGADLTYMYTDVSYNTTLNYAAQTSNGAFTCASPQFYTCGDLPNIVSEMTQVKLTGAYQVDKRSKVVVRYVYQMLNAADYYYNGYQMGNTPNTLMPTNQQSGSYSINLVTVAYQYTF